MLASLSCVYNIYNKIQQAMPADLVKNKGVVLNELYYDRCMHVANKAVQSHAWWAGQVPAHHTKYPSLECVLHLWAQEVCPLADTTLSCGTLLFLATAILTIQA